MTRAERLYTAAVLAASLLVNFCFTWDLIERRSTTSVPLEVRTHVVLRGESLWSVAATELGDGARWRELADLNGIDDPTTLRAGSVLVLP